MQMETLKPNDLYLWLLRFVIQNNWKLFQALVKMVLNHKKMLDDDQNVILEKKMVLIYWTFLLTNVFSPFPFKWATLFPFLYIYIKIYIKHT